MQNSRWRGWFVLVMLMLSGLHVGANDSGVLVNKIAAVVGDRIILLSEVRERARVVAKQMAAMERKQLSVAEATNRALDDMINDILISDQAAQMKVEVTTQDVDSAIANMAAQNRMDMVAFEQALLSTGVTMTQYRHSIQRDLLKFKVMNLRVRARVNISDETARAFYNDQVRGVRQDAWFEGAHILFRLEEGARAVDAARLRKKALDLKAALAKGASFEALAKKWSQDQATASQGGFLGRHMPGELPKVLDGVFLDMEPGEVAGPVRTRAGFHLLLLKDREDVGVQPFESVKSAIVSQLTQKEMEKQERIWLKELRKKVFVSIRI